MIGNASQRTRLVAAALPDPVAHSRRPVVACHRPEYLDTSLHTRHSAKRCRSPYDRAMGSGSLIDTSFDVRTDTGGRDPDNHSATLWRYHQLLWGKPLPIGATFDLDAKLHHKSDLGEFWLASDGIVHTYTRWLQPARLVEVIRQVPPEETTAFYNLACTVGAYLVFPIRVRVDGSRQGTNVAGQGIRHGSGGQTPRVHVRCPLPAYPDRDSRRDRPGDETPQSAHRADGGRSYPSPAKQSPSGRHPRRCQRQVKTDPCVASEFDPCVVTAGLGTFYRGPGTFGCIGLLSAVSA
jgi:hypothetical protein